MHLPPLRPRGFQRMNRIFKWVLSLRHSEICEAPSALILLLEMLRKLKCDPETMVSLMSSIPASRMWQLSSSKTLSVLGLLFLIHLHRLFVVSTPTQGLCDRFSSSNSSGKLQAIYMAASSVNFVRLKFNFRNYVLSFKLLEKASTYSSVRLWHELSISICDLRWTNPKVLGTVLTFCYNIMLK